MFPKLKYTAQTQKIITSPKFHKVTQVHVCQY